MEINIESNEAAKPLLEQAASQLSISKFEIVEPSLHDIFVETVRGQHE